MKRKLYINTVVSLIYQVCSVVIGLLLPRLILQTYGSDVNGLAQSISQMLSIITLLDLGVGAVVQAALYKPLTEENNELVNSIYWSAKKFFNTIAGILVFYVIGLCLYYGIYKSQTYGWIYTCTLIGAIAISYFAQYYFGICNILLLNADQKVYIVTLANLFGLFANAGITIILLYLKMDIQIVKLASSIIYLLRPLLLEIYVRKHYSIRKERIYDKNAIPQKWSGLAQHIAVVVTNSIDNVVLTVFSSFSVVSIYSVYTMPLNAIRTLLESTSTGYKSFFGVLIAQGDKDKLNKEFDKYEIAMHYVITIVFIVVLKTLIPFVLVYTSVVTDINYNDRPFCLMISLAYMIYSLRVVYTNAIAAAGKFRETQSFCIIECVINAVLSISLVRPLGLTGVAIGTAVSCGYRLAISVWYLKRDILNRPLKKIGMQLLVDCIAIIIALKLSEFISCSVNNFIEWTIYAAIISILTIIVCTIVFVLLEGKKLNIYKWIKGLGEK